MYYGAKWWKVDFHLHTPDSPDYRESEISCRDYLLAAMSKELDCIVISDHNSCGWLDSLRAELASMNEEQPEGYREIVIFPGVELDVFPSIHLLAIFDPSKTSREVNAAIASIQGAGNPMNFQDAVKQIQHYGGIPIPAHVDDVKGLFLSMGGNGLKAVLHNCEFFAAEVVNSAYVLPQLCQDMKLEYTYVMGSDAHALADIGRRFSWVKMENPTVESLALALQDGEDGVITDGTAIGNPNVLGDRCYIEELTVQRGQKIGNGSAFCVHFSPWLNTIIGGRGSGKTAITEYLRIVLDKTQNLPKEIENTFQRFAKIPSERTDVGMLRQDTKIESIIFKDGRRLKLSWENGIWSEYYHDDGEWKLGEGAGNVGQRFPVQIYSQKQLYEMAEDPNCLIHYIDSLYDYHAWLQKLEALSGEYKSMCRKERELRKKLLNEATLRAQLADVNAKINMLELAANDPVIADIKEFTSQYTGFETELETILARISEMQRDILQRTLMPQTEISSILDDTYSQKYQGLIREWSSLMSDYETLQERLGKIRKCAEEIREEHINHLSPAFKEAKTRYAQTIDNLRAKGISGIDELDFLYTQRASLEDAINDMIYWERELAEILARKQSRFNDIMAHQKMLRDERNRVIAGLNSDQVRITLLPMQDAALAEMEFRNIIRKDTQFQSDIFDSERIEKTVIGQLCILSLRAADIWSNRATIISGLLNDTRKDLYGKRFSDYIASLCEEHPEDMDALSIWVPPDAIQLEISMNGRFTNIVQGSAGQKTTALLSLILNSNTGPLIIDQPEDDLDTKLISEMLVNGLRSQKRQNQVIVVTHNPNIPVNGAAEQILAMNFVNGQISCKFEGALQKQAIRNEICDVMEGGRDALKKRYYRIYKPLSS